MKTAVLFLFLISCTYIPLSVAAQTQPKLFSSRLELQFQHQMLLGIALPDSHAAVTPVGDASLETDSLPHSDSRGPSYFSLTARPLRFYGLERYELSPLDCAIQGADMGLTMGLFIGALGASTGLLDESGAWYIAGAMTALGTLLNLRSSTKNPALRVRYRWEEE